MRRREYWKEECCFKKIETAKFVVVFCVVWGWVKVRGCFVNSLLCVKILKGFFFRFYEVFLGSRRGLGGCDYVVFRFRGEVGRWRCFVFYFELQLWLVLCDYIIRRYGGLFGYYRKCRRVLIQVYDLQVVGFIWRIEVGF